MEISAAGVKASAIEALGGEPRVEEGWLMETWQGKDYYKKLILKRRDQFNDNNIVRTLYYIVFWEKHPEVAWALLEHLISRNAGYHMSDLARLKGRLQATILKVSDAIPALFGFLEVGNLLIVRDVCPALEAYEWAKKFPRFSDSLFDMLDHSDFDIDPFIIGHWRSFFQAGINHNWSLLWIND